MNGVNVMNKLDNFDNEGIDLKETLMILKRRYMVIVLITLAAVVASGIYSYFFAVSTYQADAVLMVTQVMPENRNKSGGEGMEGLVDSITKLPEMTINTYVSQLKSEAVMERVIKELKLDKAGYTARNLARSVAVEADKDTELIKLAVTNTNPFLAAKIANTVTQEFMDFISETNKQQINKSMEFLQKQAAANGEELKKAAAKLNELEAQPRGVIMLEKLIAAKTEDLTKYQSQFLQAGMEYQQALAGKKQAEQQLKNTPLIIEISKFDERLGKSILVEEVNPAYTELASMINQKTVLAEEKGVEVTTLQTVTRQLTEELKGLQSEVGRKKNSLQIAQNEVKRLEQTNSLLRSKLDETNISKSIIVGDKNLAVISPATLPGGPVAPNKMKNMFVALVLGLVVSIGIAFVLNYFDNTVKTPKDLEEILGLPVLGQIPCFTPNKPGAIGR